MSGEQRKVSRWTKWLAAALAVVGLYALAGFVALPRIAQDQLAKRLPAELGRPVAIGGVEFNPFTLALRVRDARVGEPAGETEFAGFDLLEARASWRSLLRLAPVVSSVSLQRPRVRIARDAQGRFNWQDLADKWGGQPPSTGGPPAFSVSGIAIDDGRVVFDDAKLGARHEVAGLALRVPFVSSLPGDEQKPVEPDLRGTLDGAAFALGGTALPFAAAREAALALTLDGVDLARLAGYVPTQLPVEVRAARLGAKLKIGFRQPQGAPAALAIDGSAALAGLDLRQPGGAALASVESVEATSISVAWPQNRHAIGRVAIVAPQVNVQRGAQGRFLEPVLAALERSGKGGAGAAAAPASQPAPAAPSPAADAQAAPAAAAPQWRVDEVAVSGGKLAFEDAQFAPRPLRIDAGAIEIAVRGLQSDPDAPAEFEATAVLDGGERAQASGSAHWQRGEVDAKAQASAIALKRWWWIAAPWLDVEALEGEAALGARVRVTPAAEGARAGSAIRVDDGALQLRKLSLRQRWDRRALLTLPQLDVEGASVDLAQRRVEVTRLSTRGGRLLLRRDQAGSFNLQRLVRADAGKARTGGARAAAAAPSGPDWTVALAELAIASFGVDVEDQRGGKDASVRVTPIELRVRRLSTAGRAPPATVDLRARVDRRGTLAVNGSVGLSPMAGTLRVKAQELVLLPLQPYFTDHVDALVTSGAFSADGQLRFAVPPRGAPRVSWKGGAALSDFAAVTREASSELMRWKSLAFDAVEFDLEPLKVDVGGILLEDFYLRAILSAEGKLNLAEVFTRRTRENGTGAASGQAAAPAPVAAQAPAAQPAAQPAAPGRTLRIGAVRLANGNVDFSDYFIKPNYSANLTGMSGQVSQITPTQAGDVELRGRIDHTGSVEILGKVNPLAAQLFLDLKANASDIDLPRLSPYSAKYVGYGIEKGKLSAKVSYKVENRQLSAENNIVLDQLTFGEKVDSPDAIKLPVLFAVSLLKDRNGVIDVNLPISGSLDDPQFSVGGIVVRMIVNLIVKVITAPFTLLANLAGAGGAELSWVAFEPGRAALAEPAIGKLEKVAKALADRPGLKLDLAGRADPVSDREALRQLALERAVKAQKLKETVSGGDVAAIDQVAIEPKERDKYLERAWRAAKFDKPRNALGFVKSQPPAEMERMMLAHVEVADGDLLRLANDRAQHAKDWLLGTGKIEGERVFIVAPKLGADGGAAPEAAATPATPGASPAPASATPAPAPAAARGAAAPPSARVDLRLK